MPLLGWTMVLAPRGSGLCWDLSSSAGCNPVTLSKVLDTFWEAPLLSRGVRGHTHRP